MWVEALDSKPSTQLGVQHFFTPWCGGADGARDATLYLLVVGTYCARAAIGSKVRVHGRVHGGRTRRRVKERAGSQSGVGVGERVCKNLACWVPSVGLQRQRSTCGNPRERQWQKSNTCVWSSQSIKRWRLQELIWIGWWLCQSKVHATRRW